MAASIKIPTTFTAIDRFSRVVSRMTKGMKSFVKTGVSGMQRLDHKVTRTFKKLGRLGQLGLGVGAGFIARDAIETVSAYEQANADLSAVMNTNHQNQMMLQKDAERLGAITAKSATEVVGLQEAYARLGFETKEIIDMTGATIAGSIAMNAELSDTAELAGAVVKTFDDFSSIDAPNILDKMTLSTQKSALNFEKLQTAIPIVASAANAAGMPFERMLALLGKLSDAGIDASSSSTALRNILLDSASKGHSYEQILENIQKNQDKLTAANDAFGKRGAISATILSGKLQEVSKLSKELTENFKGAAEEASKKRLDAFGGSLILLLSAYEGLLIKSDQNSGALKHMNSVVKFVTNNIETLAAIVVSTVGSFILMKGIVWGSYAAITAYNIVLGLSTAITQTNKRALVKNVVAQTAYRVAMGIGTAVTWLATAATTAFGIALNLGLWPILAIIAAIVAVIFVIKNWSKITAWFGEKWGQFTTWISEAWSNVVKWFTDFDFKQMFMDIGQSILTFMLMPLKTMLSLLSNLPGKVGDIAKMGLDKIGEVTGQVSVEGESESLPSTNQSSSENVQKTMTSNELNISIRDKGRNVEKIESKGSRNTPINLTPNLGGF